MQIKEIVFAGLIVILSLLMMFLIGDINDLKRPIDNSKVTIECVVKR
jgi:hypothetical protein